MFTRAQAETILTRRLGPMMAAAEMDGETADGTNPDLNDPLGWAVRKLEGTVADPVAVAGADLDTVSADDTDNLLGLAELRALNNVLGNLTLVDLNVGPRGEKFGQLRDGIEARITKLEKSLAVELGATLVAGIIEMDFAEHEAI